MESFRTQQQAKENLVKTGKENSAQVIPISKRKAPALLLKSSNLRFQSYSLGSFLHCLLLFIIICVLIVLCIVSLCIIFVLLV